MKTKTKKIIAVVVAVLFTLTIIGAIIVSVVVPKNDKVYASADTATVTADTPPFVNMRVPLAGCYLFAFPAGGSGTTTSTDYTLNTPILIGTLVTSYIHIVYSSDGIPIQIMCTSLNDNSRNTVYGGGRWYNTSYQFWCFPFYTRSYDTAIMDLVSKYGTPALDNNSAQNIQDIIYNTGYEDGYNKGYDRGYESGHNSGSSEGYDYGYEIGYNEGYDIGVEDGIPQGYETGYNDGHSDGYSAGRSMGHTDQITNPLTALLTLYTPL